MAGLARVLPGSGKASPVQGEAPAPEARLEVGPLRPFSWREVAPPLPLPLGGGEAPASGLLVYEAPEGREAAV